MNASTTTPTQSPIQSEVERLAAPLATLANIDRYLDAAGYDSGHPWRLEIGASLAAASPAATNNTEIDTARAIGCDCANEWINRAPDAVIPPASLPAWRARCYADSVHEYEDKPDFLELLAAWENGFDDLALEAAPAASATKPVPSKTDTIKRLTSQANTIAALLSVIHILEPAYRNDSLAACASIAEELAADVAELVEVTA